MYNHIIWIREGVSPIGGVILIYRNDWLILRYIRVIKHYPILLRVHPSGNVFANKKPRLKTAWAKEVCNSNYLSAIIYYPCFPDCLV